MLKLIRYKNNPILTPSLENKWESGAVFNPCVIEWNKKFHMLYRAIPSLKRENGSMDESKFKSYIGYAMSEDGIHFQKRKEPFMRPDQEYDCWGCEDPRIIKFGEEFYIFYTAIDAHPYEQKVIPKVALAQTRDFKEVKKYGIAIPPQIPTKAGALFPQRINGKIGLLFTAYPDSPKSSICITYFEDISQLIKPPEDYWRSCFSSLSRHIVLKPSKDSFVNYEVGAPPIKTQYGWLLIFCKIYWGRNWKKEQRKWTISAALLELKNPQKILGITNEPILEPEKEYEIEGLVPNVTFPSGAIIKNETLYVYYGAGDQVISVATANMKDLLKELSAV